MSLNCYNCKLATKPRFINGGLCVSCDEEICRNNTEILLDATLNKNEKEKDIIKYVVQNKKLQSLDYKNICYAKLIMITSNNPTSGTFNNISLFCLDDYTELVTIIKEKDDNNHICEIIAFEQHPCCGIKNVTWTHRTSCLCYLEDIDKSKFRVLSNPLNINRYTDLYQQNKLEWNVLDGDNKGKIVAKTDFYSYNIGV